MYEVHDFIHVEVSEVLTFDYLQYSFACVRWVRDQLLGN